MTRFGDFTLVEELGRSAVADRYQATHETQGGPLFLKVYSRLDAPLHAELLARCDRLLGRAHPNLAPHLGHGVVDGLPFAVSPYLDGIDLNALSTSLLDRRVHIGLESVLMLLGDLAAAVGGLHASSPTSNGRDASMGHAFMAHGDVSIGHVRLGPDGQTWLTGTTTPRGPLPNDARWDLAGVGALAYDLVPLLHGGAARPPLPAPLDKVVRRALGIGTAADLLQPTELCDRLQEVGTALKLKPDRSVFAELVRRTVRALERRSAEQMPAGLKGTPRAKSGTPVDATASLVPGDRLPILEPIGAAAARAPRPMIPDSELLPVGPGGVGKDVEAMTELLVPAPTAPVRPMPTARSEARAPELQVLPIVEGRTVDQAPPRPDTPPPPAPSTHFSARPTAAAAPSPAPSAAPPRPQPVAAPVTVSPLAAPTPPAPTPPAPTPTAPTPTAGVAALPAPWEPRADGNVSPRRTRPGVAKPLLADPPEAASVVAAPPAAAPGRDGARTEQTGREPAVVALLSRRLITEQALAAAVNEHARRGGRVVEILIAAGAVTDAAVADALAAESGRPRISDADLRARVLAPALVRRLPQTYVLARRVLPLSLVGGVLTVAVADPFDQPTLDELKKLLTATTLEPLVGARAAITATTVEAYRTAASHGPAQTVLLCTADDASAAHIGARLAQEGMRVELVVDGDAAREILAMRAPSVVICAHDLPLAGAGGESTAPLLLFARGRPATADTPFFVYGPHGDETLATRFLDLGADDYFTAPLNLEVLLAKMRRAVGKGRVGSESSTAYGATASAATLFVDEGPAPFLDEATPVTAVPPSPAGQPQMTTGPSFIDKVAMSGLDDLPSLPAGFDDEPQMAPAMPTGVMGTLRQMSLAEIVQSLEMGRKTARVELMPAAGDKGMIAFESGQIRYAECGSLRGEEAFYQLARHTEGFFRIHYGDKPPETNITRQTTFLLLEAMRRLDEEGHARGG
jgi:CheY-like chemotaxis protein